MEPRSETCDSDKLTLRHEIASAPGELIIEILCRSANSSYCSNRSNAKDVAS